MLCFLVGSAAAIRAGEKGILAGYAKQTVPRQQVVIWGFYLRRFSRPGYSREPLRSLRKGAPGSLLPFRVRAFVCSFVFWDRRIDRSERHAHGIHPGASSIAPLRFVSFRSRRSSVAAIDSLVLPGSAAAAAGRPPAAACTAPAAPPFGRTAAAARSPASGGRRRRGAAPGAAALASLPSPALVASLPAALLPRSTAGGWRRPAGRRLRPVGFVFRFLRPGRNDFWWRRRRRRPGPVVAPAPPFAWILRRPSSPGRRRSARRPTGGRSSVGSSPPIAIVVVFRRRNHPRRRPRPLPASLAAFPVLPRRGRRRPGSAAVGSAATVSLPGNHPGRRR